MPHTDDMIMPHEQRRFAIADRLILQMRRARDHEQLVAIQIDLGQLVRLDGVLHRQRMKIICARQGLHFFDRGVGYANPDKFGLVGGAIDPFVDCQGAHALTIAVEKGGYHGHGRLFPLLSRA